MPDETALTIPTNQTELAALMAEYGEQSDVDARFRAGLDERKITPEIVMPKESDAFIIRLNGDTMATRKVLYVSMLDLYGTRALFAPETDKAKWNNKMPVCSMGFVDPLTLDPKQDKGMGKWLINEHYPQPYDSNLQVKVGERVSFNCNECPWNKFETKGQWERKDSGKAKACGEHRTLFLRLMAKGPPIPTQNGEELNFFAEDKEFDRMMLMTISMGSNRKAIQDIFTKTQARGINMHAAVFKLTISKAVFGSFTVSVLEPDFAGMVIPTTYRNVVKPGAIEAAAFAKRNSNVVVATDDEVEAAFG